MTVPMDLNTLITTQQWTPATRKCQTDPQSATTWSTHPHFFDCGRTSKVLPIHIASSQRAGLTSTTHTTSSTTTSKQKFLRTLIQTHPLGLQQTESAYGRLPIHIACIAGAPLFVILMLLEFYPEGASSKDTLGRVPLHYACKNGASVGIIRALVHYSGGKAVRDVDFRGWLPLHVACSSNAHPETVRLLIESYPESVGVRTVQGSTALMCTSMMKVGPNASAGGGSGKSYKVELRKILNEALMDSSLSSSSPAPAAAGGGGHSPSSLSVSPVSSPPSSSARRPRSSFSNSSGNGSVGRSRSRRRLSSNTRGASGGGGDDYINYDSTDNNSTTSNTISSKPYTGSALGSSRIHRNRKLFRNASTRSFRLTSLKSERADLNYQQGFDEEEEDGGDHIVSSDNMLFYKKTRSQRSFTSERLFSSSRSLFHTSQRVLLTEPLGEMA